MTDEELEREAKKEYRLYRSLARWSLFWNGTLALIVTAVVLLPPIIFLIGAIATC